MAGPFTVMIDHKDIDLVFEMNGIVRMLLHNMFQSDHVVGITQKHLIGRIRFNSDFGFVILSVITFSLSGLHSAEILLPAWHDCLMLLAYLPVQPLQACENRKP